MIFNALSRSSGFIDSHRLFAVISSSVIQGMSSKDHIPLCELGHPIRIVGSALRSSPRIEVLI